MIALEQLQEMFGNIRRKTKWDVDGPMLWGYFFTDSGPERLQRTADFLMSRGYRFVGINENAPGYFVLHVERVETDSAETLFELNAEFYEVADRFGVDSYDGTVGSVMLTN